MIKKVLMILLLAIISGSLFHVEAQVEDFMKRADIRIPTDPILSVYYGLSDVSLRGFDYTLADPELLEIKIGLESREFLENNKRIIDLLKRYVSISNISTDIGGSAGEGTIESNIWRVGLVSENGYGYSLSSQSRGPSVILSHSNGMTWSDMNFGYPATVSMEGLITERFRDGIRFGATTEAEISVQLPGNIAVNGSFERSIIYERHLFWKWLGSVVVEGAAQGLVDKFVDKVFESSPTAGPVVNFILKNGLAYGIYELRRSNMNWPFDTAAPLHFDSFKIGLTFTF